MEREVGEGIWMGNTCKPMAVSFQCMIKFTTNKKKKRKEKKVLLFDKKLCVSMPVSDLYLFFNSYCEFG